MHRIIKFLSKVDGKLSVQLRAVLTAIVENRLEGLDIAPLVGRKNVYRCRVRTVRILFVKGQTHNTVIDLDFRGSVYRKRR